VLALGCALLDAATAAEGDAALASVTVLGHYDNAIGTTDAASRAQSLPT
jgi:hypothetical protein